MINKSKVIKDAQKFVAKGQLDKAIAEYDKILKEAPNDANTLNTVGDLYLKRSDKENAIESFKKAASVFNKDGFTLKAIALYKKVLNINPDQVDILMLMGKLNAERGLIASANEHYLTVAAYFSRQGQKVKAIDIYKTLCDLNPENLSLTQTLVELYISEGFEKEGLSKLIELADKKIAQGELAEAREFLATAAPKSADRCEFMRVSALLELKENRLPEAITQLEKARSLDPTDTRTASLLAEALHRAGRYEEAAGIYQDLLQKDPKDNSCRKQLVDVCIKAGDYASAWKEYSVLVEDHLAKNEFNEAEELIRTFIKLKHDDIEARQALINIYQKTGRENEIPAVHREMAEIYFKAGDTGKAANIYRQALEKDPGNAEIAASLSEIELGAPEAEVPETPPVEAAPPPEEVPEFPALEEGPAAYGLDEGMESGGLPPDEGMDTGGLPQVEEIPSGAGAYELPEEPVEFPDLDLGDESPFGETPETEDKVFELPDIDMGGLEGLDVFETPPAEEGFPEIAEGETDVFSSEAGPGDFGPSLDEAAPPEAASEAPVSDFPALHEDSALSEPAPAETASEAPADLEEQLAEIDVYIKYGLLNKAEEMIINLEITYPANLEITKKKIEICKVNGDVDGFVRLSTELAELYVERGMPAEAEDVVERALAMDPDNALLVSRLETLSEMVLPGEDEPVLEMDEPVETFAPPETEAGMLPGSVHYIEDMAEADFYAQQGLVDEAREIYRRMLAANPGSDELKARLDALQGAKAAQAEVELVTLEKSRPARPETVTRKAPEPVPAAPASSLDDDLDAAFREMDMGVEEAPGQAPVAAAPAPSEGLDESEFFDLAAELQEEMEEEIIKPEMPVESFDDKHLEAVFHEFKKGVEEQLGKEDYETHYNLGIAYKEMGMLDEAVSEFTLASRDPSRSLDCASMLGLCYMEKAEYDKAIALFRKGLDIKGRDKEEYMGLKYDMATAYEQSGDMLSAYACFKDIAETDEGFRDVKEMVESLKKALGDSVLTAKAPVGKGPAEKPAAPAKKSKVSYL